MAQILTVVVDTNGREIQATVDALRAANILAESIEFSDKEHLFVNAGFPHPDSEDGAGHFDEVDARVRSALDKAGIEGNIAGHGISDGANFGSDQHSDRKS